MTTTTLAPDAIELRALCALPTEQALPGAAVFLADLVRGPPLGRPDRSFSLQVFVWPPGTRTMIHDHSSWGAYACAAGSVLEERYERMDDGTRYEHARLEGIWQLPWSPEDGASTVLPGDEGIHRVGNPYGEAAVSVHLYGPRMEDVDGRDYDPSRDYVCDRLDDATDEMVGSAGQEWPVHGVRER